MTAVNDLVAEWRVEALGLRSRYGAEGLAKLCETHADELEAALVAHAEEELPLSAAAEESGYSVSQLRRLFPGRNRLRRGELPCKPGIQRAAAKRRVNRPPEPGVDPVEEDARGDFRARLRARAARTGRPG